MGPRFRGNDGRLAPTVVAMKPKNHDTVKEVVDGTRNAQKNMSGNTNETDRVEFVEVNMIRASELTGYSGVKIKGLGIEITKDCTATMSDKDSQMFVL
jgi:hypothetical protein